jgi:DNA-binding NarL/FixJ family response regulator
MKASVAASNSLSFRESYSERVVPLTRSDPRPANHLQSRRPPGIHLTPRELEVLALLCEGLPNKVICRRLDISSGTVKVHIGNILRELGVASRLQAVIAAYRHGLLARS